MAARARRARPGHARRARAREGREDSHLALVFLTFTLVSAPYHPVPCEVIGTLSDRGRSTHVGVLPDDGQE